MQDSYEDRELLVKIWKAYKAKKRDIGLEQEILAKSDPGAACLYAIHVIKGEWPAAEHIIGDVSAIGHRTWKGYVPKFPNASGKLVLSPKNNRRGEISVDVTDSNFCNTSITRNGISLSTPVAHAYLRLTGKRLKSVEEKTKSEIVHSWYAKKAMSYVRLVYEKTGEIIDFDNGMVAVKIIDDIKNNEFSKKPISYQDKENIIKELEQRMTLYSFAGIQQDSEPVQSSGRRGRRRGRRRSGPMGAIKNYFEGRVEAMNELFKVLGEHDENMTIAELKKVLRNEAV